MADFVQTSNNKTAVRELTVPIADVASFDAIVQDVLTNNPFLCEDYESGGEAIDGVTKGRESYTARIIYEDMEAKTVGTISAKAQTIAGFNANVTELLGNADLEAAMGGTAIRDSEKESYSCQLKCHDANGEIYYVTLNRKYVRISSYEEDAIRDRVETWADGVPALA